MKKFSIILMALALLFAFATVSSAAPLKLNNAGQLSIFSDYGGAYWGGGLGVGYGLSKTMTVGGGLSWHGFQGFANLAMGDMIVQATASLGSLYYLGGITEFTAGAFIPLNLDLSFLPIKLDVLAGGIGDVVLESWGDTHIGGRAYVQCQWVYNKHWMVWGNAGAGFYTNYGFDGEYGGGVQYSF